MKITKTLAVKEDEYFQYLIDALQHELKNMGKRAVKKSDLKAGYKFVKKYKQGKQTFEVHCTIEALERPNRYQIRMEAPSSTQTISHTVSKVSEDEISLLYEEDVLTNSIMIKLNKFMSSWSSKRKMNKMLGMLEAAIINRREGNNEE